MNKYIKYGIEFVVFMIILSVLDVYRKQDIAWTANVMFSFIILIAQMMIDKRKDRFNF